MPRKTVPTPPRHIDYLPLDDLIPAERNPKQHDIDGLISSVEQFGFVAAGVLDERTGRLVVGHGRAAALREMRERGDGPPAGVVVDAQGRWTVPVTRGWSSTSDDQAERYLIADNQWTILGGWNDELLAEMLRDLDTLDGTGYDAADLDDLVAHTAGGGRDLDDLAGEVGEPGEADLWPTLRVRVAPHVAAAWRDHLGRHGDNDNAAMAALLDVKPVGEAATWEP